MAWLEWHSTVFGRPARPWVILSGDISLLLMECCCLQQSVGHGEVPLGSRGSTFGLWWQPSLFSHWHSAACGERVLVSRLKGPFLSSPYVHVFTRAFVDRSPWMLSIWPSFRAAPRTLQRVATILSALASERKALESRMDFFSPEEQTNCWLQVI